ncbi:MAG: hypothetical protein DMG40_14680 [Acidobacteria bacterium]|nr:MAG: hypothetical protein DMG40_14680 [Acidobacteriota bacterium]
MMAFRFLVFLPFVAFSLAARPAPQQAPPEPDTPQAQSTTAAPAGNMTVYVSDFDLDVVRRKPAPKPAPSRTSPPAKTKTGGAARSPSGVPRMGAWSSASASTPESSAPQTSDSSDDSMEETPDKQAHALVNAVSEHIIRALKEAGYDVRRLAAGAPPPQQGVRILGVFAEADEQNRARRLLVGGEPTGSNIILYVGVNNLKSPEQPLYALANPPAPDPRHGPVITVSSYAPAERFELSRDPSGDELKKVATKIAADLTTLVNANRLSLAP